MQPQKELQLDLNNNNNNKNNTLKPSDTLAIWKCDIQGFKDPIFIQMGRRGKDEQRGGEAQRHSVVQRGR